METITQILLQGIMLILIPMTNGGLGPPINKQELLLKLFGNPCDCRGGKSGVIPTSYTRIADCGSSTAFLIYKRQMGGGYEQSWKCVEKPKIIPMVNGEPGPCPSDCQKAIVLHSTCYNSVQQCSHTDGKIYLTAVLQRTYSGSFGGKYDYSHPLGHSKYAQASCRGMVGKDICWPPQAPIHVSDGGGPTDRVREAMVQKQIEEIIKHMYPPLQYHPLALPKSRGIDLDTQTSNILEATLRALNVTNPTLAGDCWLCMTLGTPMPLAIPANTTNVQPKGNCSVGLPFRIQPIGFNTSLCLQSHPQNDNYDLDVGFTTFTNCSSIVNYTSSLCPAPGQVFVCGGNMAFTALPTNWTGLYVQAIVLPDIDIIPGRAYSPTQP